MIQDMAYLKGVATLELAAEKCTGCGMCLEACTHAVMRLENNVAVIADRDACMECSACARNCPEKAITVQSGVGCAQAVINSALGRTSASCCTLEDYGTSGPRDPGSGCQDAPEKSKRSSGCC